MSSEKAPEKLQNKSTKIALILIRGLINLSADRLRTLKLLNLGKKHVCVVVEDNVITRGMATKVKDYVAWGEVDDATVKLLQEKRGKKDPKDSKKLKKYFTLAPPVGGFERGGIKTQFTKGGALGYRGDKINDLIKKMI
ncbi:50S ribosomal protein L30 [Candidatus Woesearchaeota archaeon CG08_land_8_20_14_0_20_43_7]|nr:MAG: 50S ribosomal protein L30 [Candidatus Woesearchaeota archaeon CG08_land_8_20_14_0_20_43_7]